jgi:GT2 family glycosyltransferase
MNFSVIIPLYNREDYIAAAIESALAQELAPHQVIVVDDGSTDRGVEVVERFGDRVELYRQTNQGCAAARNLGIEHATGEYIAFLDSDDIWYPWTLRLLAEGIETHGHPPLLATAMLPFTGESPLPAEPSEPVVKVYPDLFSSRRTFATSVLVARRDIVEQAGGFVPINMNGTDLEFNLRVGAIGPMAVFESPPMLAYRKHGSNVTNSMAGTFRGLDYMIEQERAAGYAGVKQSQAKRREFITALTRANSLAALRSGEPDLAWQLYRKTFAWNLAQGRVRYLVGYWVKALGARR